MARRSGRAPRPTDRAPAAPDDDASALERFLRLVTEADATAAGADSPGAWSRFFRRLTSHGDDAAGEE